MIQVYFLFLYCIEFPFKSNKSMYKVWFARAPTYREIQNPFYYTRRLAESLLGLNCAIKIG